MSNANAPAYPALYGQTNGADGLTKRELFAKDIYCAILSRNQDASYALAAEHADKLLATLERTKCEFGIAEVEESK